jgi:uncharacterized heparinase superfamily protein
MEHAGISWVGRALRKPPKVVLHRMLTELHVHADRFRAPRRVQAFDGDALLASTAATDISSLWKQLSSRMYAIPATAIAEADYNGLCPGDAARILREADDALAHRVDLLGTGPVELGTPIEWHRDFKVGKSWPAQFMRDINYSNLGCPSDVKVPWEISRLQWLMPAGQAFLLSGDERYAWAVRDVLDDWIGSNPYAHGVNWACTMEVAMRILSWTWLFHVFSRSQAWADEGFQSRFLRALYLHGEFTERYLERSDINGNHFTADAAALVFAGLFFGRGVAARRWADTGWRMLCDELPRQVTADGVDFEASIPYHRLVLELFFLAARYREAAGLDVSDGYRDRVIAMARFAQLYTRHDGSSPLVGDADDARALPFGGQATGDHRYLAGLVGAHWCVRDLMDGFSGPRAEIVWTLGRRAAASLPDSDAGARRLTSASFPQGGFHVMRNACDHVFIDCGPVGQAGRGGHGHNDCLSFEAALDGVHLVTDCGAYVYTADAHERNRFRSTGFHNTPQVDGAELNRFVRWDHLWTLHNDAAPELKRWSAGADEDVLVGSHSGYDRLDSPVRPTRRIVLDHGAHALTIEDVLDGNGEHKVSVPLHLAPGVKARIVSPGLVTLNAGGKEFELHWSSPSSWTVEIAAARVSPSYGIAIASTRLLWRYSGEVPVTLTMTLAPRSVNKAATRSAGARDLDAAPVLVGKR